MWLEAKDILNKVNRVLDLKEIHVVGSLISKKENINDIDFAVVVKTKNKKTNSAYPIDLIILPDTEDTKEYLDFFQECMKKKYGSSFKPVRLK